jgi:hypothetical protein
MEIEHDDGKDDMGANSRIFFTVKVFQNPILVEFFDSIVFNRPTLSVRLINRQGAFPW